MKRLDFEFDSGDAGGQAAGVAGTAEGDGDFETDNLASTGETSGGGQVSPTQDTRDGLQGRAEPAGGLKEAIDEVSSGKILP
jgi:hypothetical protein